MLAAMLHIMHAYSVNQYCSSKLAIDVKIYTTEKATRLENLNYTVRFCTTVCIEGCMFSMLESLHRPIWFALQWVSLHFTSLVTAMHA